MSQKLGPVYYERDLENPFLGRQIATEAGSSDSTSAAIEAEARHLLGGAFERAAQMLGKYDVELRRLVGALLDRETIERPELEALLGSSGAPRPASDHAEPIELTH
jgi:cell division protease FtsH